MPKCINVISLNEVMKRIALEYRYFTCKNWSLQEVGNFWDSVTNYDEINEHAYSYYRRFTDSWKLARDFVRDNMLMLDIQSRSGKGSEFWFEKGLIKKAFLVDFSDFLLDVANNRLSKGDYDYEVFKISNYRLPFEDNFFDLVATYETIEHIGDVYSFVAELSRVLKPGGIMVVTCPNILWEPIHWLAAVFDIHHSEGPHNFLRRQKLFYLFRSNNLEVLGESATVILPFNEEKVIAVGERMEENLPENIVRFIALRRCFVLRKGRRLSESVFMKGTER